VTSCLAWISSQLSKTKGYPNGMKGRRLGIVFENSCWPSEETDLLKQWPLHLSARVNIHNLVGKSHRALSGNDSQYPRHSSLAKGLPFILDYKLLKCRGLFSFSFLSLESSTEPKQQTELPQMFVEPNRNTGHVWGICSEGGICGSTRSGWYDLILCFLPALSNLLIDWLP
jgi:hypothetical protein